MQKRKSARFITDISLCALSVVLYVISAFLFYFYSARTAMDLVLLATVAADAAIVFYSFKNLRRHIVLFIFTVCYNILLLGRVFTTSVENHGNLYLITGTDSPYHLFISLSLVYISLAVIFGFYRLFGLFFKKQEDKIGLPNEHKSDRLIPIVRVLALIALSVAFIFEFYQLAVNVRFVLSNGYLQSFIERPVIPYFVRVAASLFFPAFALYLATKPNAKQLIYPVILYCITNGVSVLTGRRNIFVRAVLLLIVYAVMRDDLRKSAGYFITKFKVAVCAAAGSVGIYVLQEMRSGFKTPFIESLFNFIYDQGASFGVIIKTVIHRGDLTGAPFRYLFYPVEYMLNNSLFADALFHLPQIVEVQTEQFVMTTFNYAHKLTYLSEPERYLSGGGYGAAFIADGYIAAGFVGAILVGVMTALLLRFMPSLLTRSFTTAAFGLIIVRYILYMPRNFALGWIVDAFSPICLAFFGAVYLAAYLIDRYKSRR